MALSYEQRVAKMKTVTDIGDQLRKAINAAKERKRAMALCGNFSQKIEINREFKDAESVVRKIRSNLFDLENSFAVIEQTKTNSHYEIKIQSEGLFAF
ncbi:hypothetical protein [Thiomicrorhabdus aquaedulcis]|uniref:hypothetical protein n=1 Tax=Thiomicrorhabdus aquaedulcis TaxID=2211106 RepID=UPI000FD76E84|nr:hypothetical protein [Thiomicrorhabdus aquaedulcis]